MTSPEQNPAHPSTPVKGTHPTVAPRTALRSITALAVAAAIGLTQTPVATAQRPATSMDLAYGLSSNLAPVIPLDQWGRPTAQFQRQIRDTVNQPWVPQEVRDIVEQALAFTGGTGGTEPGVELPADAPRIAQFLWPTRAENCIGGTSAALASAFAVPGPAGLPLPGVAEGQSAFVFTALGTGPLADPQHTRLEVQWANLSTLTHGTVALGDTGINPDGPSTVSGVADTGRGVIVAVLSGGLSTTTDTGHADCVFAPTTVIFDVR